MTNKIKAAINTAYTIVTCIAAMIIGIAITELVEYFIGNWLNLVIYAILMIAVAIWLYRFYLKEIQDEKDDKK